MGLLVSQTSDHPTCPPTRAVLGSALQTLDFLQFSPPGENTPDEVGRTALGGFLVINLFRILVLLLNYKTVNSLWFCPISLFISKL